MYCCGIKNIENYVRGTVLDLNYENVDPIGFIKIAKLLETNSLTHLRLIHTGLNNPESIEIAKALANNVSLQELELSTRYLNSDNCIEIVKSIMINTSLQVLILKCLHLDTDTSDMICKLVSSNQRLHVLKLWCNPSIEGTIEISKNLINNFELRELRLFYKNIQSEGVVEIVNALCKNNTLTILSLSNIIGSGRFAAIAELIKINSTITELQINTVDMQFEDAVKIAESLQFNNSVQKIVIGLDNFDEIDAVTDILQNNYSLTNIFLGQCTQKIDNLTLRNIALLENRRFKNTKAVFN